MKRPIFRSLLYCVGLFNSSVLLMYYFREYVSGFRKEKNSKRNMWHMKRLIAHLTKRSRNTSIRCSIFGFDVLSLLLAKVCDVFSVIYLALLYYGHCVAGDPLLKRACTGNIWFSVGPRFLWNTKGRSFTSFELQLLPGVCLAWMYLWNNICIIGKQMLEEGPPLEKSCYKNCRAQCWSRQCHRLSIC